MRYKVNISCTLHHWNIVFDEIAADTKEEAISLAKDIFYNDNNTHAYRITDTDVDELMTAIADPYGAEREDCKDRTAMENWRTDFNLPYPEFDRVSIAKWFIKYWWSFIKWIGEAMFHADKHNEKQLREMYKGIIKDYYNWIIDIENEYWK